MISLLILSAFSILSLQVKAEALSGSSILYAGGHNPGIVYRYLDGKWEPLSPELGYAVMDLIVFNGRLYAAVTTGFGGYEGVGRVYRYDGGKKWTLVGDGMDHAVISLAVYKGELYAGTGRGAFRLYKYTPGTTNCGIQDWTRVIDYEEWDGVRSLYVSHGYLLMGDTFYDRIGRWDGNNFYRDLDDGGSCIYDFQDFRGYVYAAAYDGRLWKSPDAINWDVALGYYDGNMWELEIFQDELFMAYNNGELRAWNGIGDLRGRLVYTAPDGIISMATDGNYLYFGTGGDAVGYGAERTGIANVYRYDGTSPPVPISSEDQMGEGIQVLYVSQWPRFPVENPLNGIYWYHYPGSSGHRPNGGMYGADDTYALDLNWGPTKYSDEGKPVYAIEKGEVIQVNRNRGWVLIEHNTPLRWRGKIYTTWYSGYLHMWNIPLKFKDGVRVKVQKGEQIGEVGSAFADAPHLHFAIYVGRIIDKSDPLFNPYKKNALLESVDPGQVAGPEYSGYTYGDMETTYEWGGPGAVYNHNIDELIDQDPNHLFEIGGDPLDWFETTVFGLYGHMFYTHTSREYKISGRDYSYNNWGKWSHTILVSGTYTIYVFIPRKFAEAPDASYQIYCNGHLNAVRTVNQAEKFKELAYDRWVSLGSFKFKKGDKISIVLTDGSSIDQKWIAYDAVKFWSKVDVEMPRWCVRGKC